MLGRVCVSLLHCVQCCREACVCLHQKKRSLKWKEIGCFWVWEEDDSKSLIWLFVSQVKTCFVEKDSGPTQLETPQELTATACHEGHVPSKADSL